MTNLDGVVSSLTDAQRRLLLDGKEGWDLDRRVARALCGKGLMGVAGYVLGETVYARTHEGEAVREILLSSKDPHHVQR